MLFLLLQRPEHPDRLVEECARKAGHVGDGAEVLLQLGALAAYLQQLALGEVVEGTVRHELVDVGHLLDSLADIFPAVSSAFAVTG